MLDPVEFGKAMASIVNAATEPLLARIKALEERQPERGPPGERGEPGIAGAAGEKGATGDAGKDGANGADGKDAEQIDIRDVVAELIEHDGVKTALSLLTAEAVTKHFDAHPIRDGKDGANGANGAPGERGPDGEPGKQGEKGADGLGLAGAMIDRDGCLTITMTNGAAIKLGCVVGKDGERGKDGADFSDAAIDYDGERTVTIRGNGGEIVKRVPIPLDKGYWREGMCAEKGDIVTHAGSAWLALRDTKAKPCTENKDDWRIFARKGRDGVDGKNGRDLGPAPPVKLDASA